MGAQVLVADGDPAVLAALVLVCQAAGHRTSEAASAAQALRTARATSHEVCVFDLGLCAADDLDPLAQLLALEDAPSIILTGATAELAAAARTLGEGAVDRIEKPVRREVLERVLARVLRLRAALRERDLLRDVLARAHGSPIVGGSPAMRRLLQQVDRVASTPRTTVLVLGEAGVGKERVARAIHERSARARGPFVALNCALPQARLETELFGAEPEARARRSPGARASAAAARSGRIAAAEGGSLFLYGIGELAPALQGKLLRVLQEGVYRRIDGSTDCAMDVRVIAGTHRDLEALVEAGSFREDLYYRLNVMSLRVPALRERREDVPELAQHFLARCAAELGRRFEGFRPDALELLCAHAWPGNLRELRNTIERATLFAAGEWISLEDLGPTASAAPEAVAPALPSHEARGGETLPLGDRSLRALEEALIRRVLQETDGNRKKSAEILGINRTTLYHKLKSYQIDA